MIFLITKLSNSYRKRKSVKLSLSFRLFTLVSLSFILFNCFHIQKTEAVQYDLVFTGGRVIDPESGFDQQANIAINGRKIAIISTQPLLGVETIDASGLVISPGFIDLHSHALSKLGQKLQAMDGVTTALELEAGVYPIDALPEILGAAPIINYGASTGHLSIRQRVIEKLYKPHLLTPAEPLSSLGLTVNNEPLSQANSAFTQVASKQQLDTIKTYLQQGIDDGGLGIGLLLDYLKTAVSEEELEMIFQVAATADVPVFVHINRGLPGDPAGLEQVIDLARKHQTSVHICHLNASAMSGIEHFLGLISQAQLDGIDITTEAYPYNAGSTSISAAVFNRNWQEIFGITYSDIEWAPTGERFTEKMWNDYRKRYPTGQIIHHYGKEEWTTEALHAPGVIVASDAMPLVSMNDRVHPRGIGTFSKVLGRYTAKDEHRANMNLVKLLGKMTVLPAKRMQEFAPAFRNKGRLREGFDADLTVFDAEQIIDNATFKQPLLPSKGIQYVLVNGEFVLKEGKFIEDVGPGKLLKGTNHSTHSNR